MTHRSAVPYIIDITNADEPRIVGRASVDQIESCLASLKEEYTNREFVISFEALTPQYIKSQTYEEACAIRAALYAAEGFTPAQAANQGEYK